MGTPTLTIEGHVAVITLQRPEQANRLGADDLQCIYDYLTQINDTQEVHVLRLESTGKYFCSGFDINELGGGGVMTFESVVNALELARPVTMAVLQGGVYGGATDLALACDFRLGALATNMFMPAARLGLHYYASGMQRYVQRMGVNTAKRLFLTAERIEAEEMMRVGYLTHLCRDKSLQDTRDELTHTLNTMAPLALLGMKKHLTHLAQGTLDVAGCAQDMAATMASEDFKEGRAAWMEKRPPVFKGR